MSHVAFPFKFFRWVAINMTNFLPWVVPPPPRVVPPRVVPARVVPSPAKAEAKPTKCRPRPTCRSWNSKETTCISFQPMPVFQPCLMDGVRVSAFPPKHPKPTQSKKFLEKICPKPGEVNTCSLSAEKGRLA